MIDEACKIKIDLWFRDSYNHHPPSYGLSIPTFIEVHDKIRDYSFDEDLDYTRKLYESQGASPNLPFYDDYEQQLDREHSMMRWEETLIDCLHQRQICIVDNRHFPRGQLLNYALIEVMR